LQQFDFMHLVEYQTLSQVPMSICIGVFDGMHLGHQEILQTCVAKAHEQSCHSMVITFNKNPKMANGRQNRLPYLQSNTQFMQLLENIGIDYLVTIDFSPDFSKLSAEEFLNLVCLFCMVKVMVVGEDFRCGTPASCAGPVQLQEYLTRHEPECKVVVPPSVRDAKGEVMSSTLVREKLLKGALEDVQGMLGRPYGLDLTRYSSLIHANCLLYRIGSFEQLLPMTGTYQASLVFSDESVTPVLVRLTKDKLTIELEKDLDVKAKRVKILNLFKRSGT